MVERPGRPFGVTLAIIASVCLFSLLPLLQVGIILLVRQHFLNMDFQDSGLELIAMGGDFLGVSESNLLLQSVLSMGFLIIAILAWRGRPPSARFALIAAVFVLTALKLWSVVAPLLATPDLQSGASSLDGLMRSLGTGQFILELLVLFYVIWYMNRGPARAFYRGYYLPDPGETPASET